MRPLPDFRAALKLKTFNARRELAHKHAHINSVLLDKALAVNDLRAKSAKLLGTGAVAGAFLLTTPNAIKNLPPPAEVVEKLKIDHTGSISPVASPQKILVDALNVFLPKKPRSLTREEEKSIERVLEDVTQIPAKATLEGEHLNSTYGLIGAEQHLMRYPGDTMADQMKSVRADQALWKEGMAPGRGAWGYFAPTKAQLTPELVETEKWYAVVQTLYLPDWNTRTRYLRDWYKYRKVLIVNTVNGNAVVASIADSGPAAWTGKIFGGSPEVMMHLGGPRYKKGPVVLFFVDDPENKVPLGPVEYNKIALPEWAFHQV